MLRGLAVSGSDDHVPLASRSPYWIMPGPEGSGVSCHTTIALPFGATPSDGSLDVSELENWRREGVGVRRPAEGAGRPSVGCFDEEAGIDGVALRDHATTAEPVGHPDLQPGVELVAPATASRDR